MSKKYLEKITDKAITVYPSEFGSHSSMIDEEKTANLKNKDIVCCVDDNGPYLTHCRNLDSGLADPRRYANRIIDEAMWV